MLRWPQRLVAMLLAVLMMIAPSPQVLSQNGSMAKAASPSTLKPVWVLPTYETVNGKPYTGSFCYSDAFLLEDATEQNPCLSIASAYLAAQAYQEAYIENTLVDQLGYVRVRAEYPTATKEEPHTIGYYIAKKAVQYQNKEYTIYAVCVRGTPSSAEWIGNFAIGQGVWHEGFYTAMKQVRSALEQSITTPYEQTILWITGHSRGAAVANALAGELCDEGKYAPTSRIHAYTYATPTVSRQVNAYQNIKNYVNLADFVTRVPLHTKWGFSRYGVDVQLPNGGNTEDAMKSYFSKASGHNYQGMMKLQTDQVVSLIEGYAPSIRDYYQPRREWFGGYQDPEAFMNALAALLMGDIKTGLVGIAKEAVRSDYAMGIIALFLGLDVMSTSKALLEFDIYSDMWKLAHVMHAHAKEAYIGYMHSLYDEAAKRQLEQLLSDPGEPDPTQTSPSIPGSSTGEDGSQTQIVHGVQGDYHNETSQPLGGSSQSGGMLTQAYGWSLTHENLALRIAEALYAYNRSYGASLPDLIDTSSTHEDGMLYSQFTNQGETVQFFLRHQGNGMLDYNSDDCILSFRGGERYDGSFLQHPDFPYCYVIASCFADGATAEERLADVIAKLDLERLSQHTAVLWNLDGLTNTWYHTPKYDGASYQMLDMPDTAPFRLHIFTTSGATVFVEGAAGLQADEVRTIGNNISAYRVGDRWGVVLSDETVVCEPIYSSCFHCVCEQGASLGEPFTIAVVYDDSWYCMSCYTGELLAEHRGHCAEWSVVNPQNDEWLIYEQNGRYGYWNAKTGAVATEAIFDQATVPIAYQNCTYAWVKSENRWRVQWLGQTSYLFDGYTDPVAVYNAYIQQADIHSPETIINGTQYDYTIGDQTESVRALIREVCKLWVQSNQPVNKTKTFGKNAEVDYCLPGDANFERVADNLEQFGIVPQRVALISELDIHGDFYAFDRQILFMVNDRWYVVYTGTNWESVYNQLIGTAPIEAKATDDPSLFIGTWEATTMINEYGQALYEPGEYTTSRLTFLNDGTALGEIIYGVDQCAYQVVGEKVVFTGGGRSTKLSYCFASDDILYLYSEVLAEQYGYKSIVVLNRIVE